MENFECDNISNVHNPTIIKEDSSAMRVICTNCKNQYIIHKDSNGNPEKRMYAKIFKRDILQGNDNLFYKYNPKFINQ